MKKSNIYFLLGIGIVLMIFIVFIYGIYFASNPRDIPSSQIGKKAFEIHTVTFDGQPITLRQYLGKPIILNFWASWCATCWKEAHILEAAHQEYTPQGAVFIGIAINDEREASLRFIKKYNKTYILAPDDKTGNISLDYGVTAVPETFLIDKKGVIQNKILGAIHDDIIDQFLSKELKL
ncbi:MAG: TlpA family protein disulfide reductase [Deltaproteobacteria bacterium]|jgi:cytochrome c biogenesis protein CcmG, thiol:disulfide interchange protein DsbE|nr:TlpA family protein disulfide reductase [Deltaproteobacteria bacterium]MBT4526988.1 TlpA family protein disulfide reductase [Deltaproteobacteria bacterium]